LVKPRELRGVQAQGFAVCVGMASGLASSILPETMCKGAARIIQHIILQVIYLGIAVSSRPPAFGSTSSGITRTSSPCEAR